MTPSTRHLQLALLLLVAGCEAAQPEQDDTLRSADPPSRAAEDPLPAGPRLTNAAGRDFAVRASIQTNRERVQAHYRTTVTKTADGAEFSRGSATLEIRYATEHPRATFSLQALGKSDKLSAALPLDSAALTAVATRQVDLLISGPTVFGRTRGSELLSLPTPARLVLERVQEGDKRVRFHGRLLDNQGALSADFQTELGISCLVPPEMLGVTASGHAEGPGISLLVTDDEFKSPFCAQFSGLL